jgi:hypothetical protein
MGSFLVNRLATSDSQEPHRLARWNAGITSCLDAFLRQNKGVATIFREPAFMKEIRANVRHWFFSA